MKKTLLFVLAFAFVLGGLAWINKTSLMLGFVKYQTKQKYADQKPFYKVVWQQGPKLAAASPTQGEGLGEGFDSDNRKIPPNIVLIVADDLGFNDISTFGGGVASGKVQTPSIDQLAAEGVVFEQSYSGHNTCAPSRAMLMTGRYPSRTGFAFTPTPQGMANLVSSVASGMNSGLPRVPIDQEIEQQKPAYEEMGLPSSEITIAELLKEQGYYTAHIGKWHLGRGAGMTPQAQGFDDSLLMMSGLYLPEDSPDVVNAKLDFDPIDRFLWAGMEYSVGFNEATEPGFTPGGYLTDYYTDESIRVIDANKHRPFFLYLAHWGVHTPLQATRADYEAVGDIRPHRLRVYAAMIRALDRSVGRIMQKLEQEGIADNTVVMFTSDNGGPGYLGLPDVNSPFRGWKITSFEGGLRVPMFVKWPKKIAAGTTVSQPVAHIDVLPTLASVAGAALPSGVSIDGKNILGLASQDTASDWQRDTLFWVSDHSKVVRHGDWKLQLNDRKATSGVEKWLFDLSSDPTEQYNLAETRLDKLVELEKILAKHVADAREPLWQPSTQMAVAIDKTLVEKVKSEDEVVFSPN